MADQRVPGADSGASTDASTAELVRVAAEQISQLVRDELQLARTEMTVKVRRFGTGAGLFGAAGVVALYAIGALLAAVILLLAQAVPAWGAALIVTGVLFAIAGLTALLGRGQLRGTTPPAPDQALDSVKADVHTVTEAVRKRGQA
jgi:hypothetical protein